ncbi:hypothetical protein DMENIID0001_017360 [Sergentomyia squamirostris]
MGFLDNLLGWMRQNIAVCILSVLLFSFFISTIALAVRKNNLIDELETCQALVNPTTTAPPSGLQYRLPKNVVPYHYELLLHPNLEDQAFTGSVTINIGVTGTTNRVILNSYKLDISSVVLKSSSQSLDTTHQLDEYYQSLVVELKSGNLEHTNYTLEIEFSGSLADKNIGFYSSKYKRISDSSDVTIASSKFQPTYARQAFPCFDEPEFKATYTISLVRPSTNGYVALSNMPQKDETPSGSEVTVTFEQSPPMSTYLAVFLVADFKFEEIEIDTLTGDKFTLAIHLPDGLQEKGKYGLDVAKAVMDHHIKYFNIDYPLPKLDMAAIPDYVSGATEHWGLVTFRETSLMFDENEGSTRNKQRVAQTISHEMTHMWFGNLVTCKWWNDVWLNEGFASYIQYKGLTAYAESIGDDWKMDDQFLIETLHGVMELDSKVASHPINQEASTPDEITALFDSIAYSKGASLIRMLEGFITKEVFQSKVHNFIKDNEYKAVVTADFLHAMDKDSAVNVSEIMLTWLEQKGYPVITVKKSSETTYELSQGRFLLNPDSKDKETENSPFKWHVPITYKSDVKNSDAVLWLKPTDNNLQVNLEASSNWIKINNDQVGYYIVNYDNWNELIIKMNAVTPNDNTFTAMDRAQLLHDAFKLGDSRTITYDIPMNLTNYLLKSNETEYVPWSVVTSKLTSLYRLYVSFGESWNMQTYIHSQLEQIYAYIDPTTSSANDDHLKKLLREKIMNLACTVNLGKCIKYVNEEFNNYLNNIGKDEGKPDLDIRSVVYYHGMRSVINREDWQAVFDQFEKETDPQERAKLMEALAATMETSLLQRYLQIAQNRNGPIKKQDYVSVMQYISNNPNGEDIVWDYVRNNWDAITDYIDINDRTLGRMIPYITARFHSQERLKQLEEFFQKHPNAGAGAAAREEAKETIEHNIKWVEHNKPAIDAWLKDNVPTSM